MQVVAKVKVPDDLFRPAELKEALANTMLGAAKGAKVDFQTTTKTWETKVVFEIVGSNINYAVGTNNLIYKFVNDGTKAHEIAPKERATVNKRTGGPGRATLKFQANYKAKTALGYIGSYTGGGSGAIIFTTKPIQHPGTKPRKFDESIQNKWQKQLPIILQRSIDAWRASLK